MKKNAPNSMKAAAVVAIALGLVSASARADQLVSAQFNMPVHVTTHVDETGCDNSPGPQITLYGEIALGGLGIELIFQNNLKGTHQTIVTFETNLVLVPLGDKIVIPKQPVLGGVGGNPHIFIQFFNNAGNLSDEIYLGRCVQGLKLENDFLNATLAQVLIGSEGCYNHPGPTITFGGGEKHAGMKARIIFRNNFKGTHEAQDIREVTLLPDGAQVVIPKQPVLGGSGGNPLIWVQFLQGNSDPINGAIFLGRCNQL